MTPQATRLTMPKTRTSPEKESFSQPMVKVDPPRLMKYTGTAVESVHDTGFRG